MPTDVMGCGNCRRGWKYDTISLILVCHWIGYLRCRRPAVLPRLLVTDGERYTTVCFRVFRLMKFCIFIHSLTQLPGLKGIYNIPSEFCRRIVIHHSSPVIEDIKKNRPFLFIFGIECR